MTDFIKKNIYLIVLFIISLSIGFLTFLTFIDKGFIQLNNKNLQYLLILNIVLLVALFVFIFFEIRKAIKTDIDKDGLKSNKKYITVFALFTLIPSVLISIFSLFLFSFALEKYFDKKVSSVVNNSYELAKSYVKEVRNKIQADIVLIAFDTNKSSKFLSNNEKEYLRFLRTQKLIRNVDQIHIIDDKKKLLRKIINNLKNNKIEFRRAFFSADKLKYFNIKKNQIPNSSYVSKNLISLPLFSGIRKKEIKKITNALKVN